MATKVAEAMALLEQADVMLASAHVLLDDELSSPGPEPDEPAQEFCWSERSIKRMDGLHKDLVRLLNRAIELTPIDLTVLEGMRTIERQRELFRKGATRTMRSRHLTGHAVDIAPLDEAGKVSWDWPLYYQIEPAIKQAAEELGIAIEWGGDWRNFKDGPHWQLSWSEYPL